VKERPLWLNGKLTGGVKTAEVVSPFDGHLVARVSQASAAQAREALTVAEAARGRLQAQTSGQRRAVLLGVVKGLEARGEELAQVICEEAGKPITLARMEVARSVETFQQAAAALSTFGGELVPVDFMPHQANARAEVRRFPAGVVVGIVPFNFPLNLGVHKVAPALAVGAPIVVKPPPQAPSAQLLLAELVHAAGADPAALQVLPCDNAVAETLATDARVKVLSFTGSARVGWSLKAKAAGKAVLELGGNAAAVVAKDADVALAAQRLAASAFGYAGQVCIKVQRIIVEQPVLAAFRDAFVAETAKLALGDPRLETTVVGPVIDDAAATRIEGWVREAVAQGARLLCGAERAGRLIKPTVLEQVPTGTNLYREEVFGPVAMLEVARDFEHALERVNDGRFGLQAAVFTRDWRQARRAFEALEVGGVIIDDAPSFRSDSQPYGGVKASGLGREGVRATMDDYTEPRTLVWRA